MEQDEAGETLTITPQEDKVFRETFNSIDTYNRKWIPASQIGYALRINGQCPTEKDIEEIIQNVTEENQSAEEAKLEYDDFRAIMKQYSKTKDELNAIIDEAFLTFDKKDCGLIEESELRKALATLGEILDETEINEFMKDGKVGTDGRLPYGDFAKHLVDSYPRPGSKKKGSGKKGASAASKKSKKK